MSARSEKQQGQEEKLTPGRGAREGRPVTIDIIAPPAAATASNATLELTSRARAATHRDG
jgi:hypothetical protein